MQSKTRYENSCHRLQSIIEGKAGSGLSGLSGSKVPRAKQLKEEAVNKSASVFKPNNNLISAQPNKQGYLTANTQKQGQLGSQ